QLEPDEEGALAARPAARERGDGAVTPPLVGRAPLLDRVLRPGERCDAGFLHRHEDTRELVVLQILDARDDLCVPDREAEAPTRHAVRLRHREELEADLARALDGQEAHRLAA